MSGLVGCTKFMDWGFILDVAELKRKDEYVILVSCLLQYILLGWSHFRAEDATTSSQDCTLIALAMSISQPLLLN